jgi:hypothetical protein
LKKLFYGILVVLVLAYISVIFFLEPDARTLTRYGLDATQLRLVSLTVIIPMMAIWFAMFFSIVNVGKYAQTIRGAAEGKGFRLLTLGLIALGLTMPVNSILSRILSYNVQHGVITQSAATITTTHLNITGTLLGFFLLFIGSQKLAKTIKRAHVPEGKMAWAGLTLAAISGIYSYVTLLNPSRQVPVAPATIATYAMPDWLIAFTIVLPYILLWSFGIYATLLLGAYLRNVGGLLYQKALKKMRTGFFLVIITSIGLQFLTAISTAFAGWGLSATLALVYVLLVIIAIGYIYIALGAKGLAKLEEVT